MLDPPMTIEDTYFLHGRGLILICCSDTARVRIGDDLEIVPSSGQAFHAKVIGIELIGGAVPAKDRAFSFGVLVDLPQTGHSLLKGAAARVSR